MRDLIEAGGAICMAGLILLAVGVCYGLLWAVPIAVVVVTLRLLGVL